MNFRVLVCATVIFPFAVGAASAADRLSDSQMDTMTAGQVAPPSLGSIDCPGCSVASSSSSSLNGVTQSSSSSGSTSDGGNGSSGGNGGGNGNGGSSGSGGPGVLTGSVPIPPAVAATLSQAQLVTVTRN